MFKRAVQISKGKLAEIFINVVDEEYVLRALCALSTSLYRFSMLEALPSPWKSMQGSQVFQPQPTPQVTHVNKMTWLN